MAWKPDQPDLLSDNPGLCMDRMPDGLVRPVSDGLVKQTEQRSLDADRPDQSGQDTDGQGRAVQEQAIQATIGLPDAIVDIPGLDTAPEPDRPVSAPVVACSADTGSVWQNQGKTGLAGQSRQAGS